MADVNIKIMDNGPLIVEGPVDVEWANGQAVDTGGKKMIALCRCGASVNKPFCDGAHSKIGFKAAAEAVPESAE